MGLDQILKESLHYGADGAPVADPPWNDVVRSARVRRRRRGRLSIAVTVVVALFAAGAVVALGGDSDEPVVGTLPQRRVGVVAAIDSRVVELSTDGVVVSTLASAPDGRKVSSVSNSPDAATVYFTVGELCGLQPEVWRVAATGGDAERISAFGYAPLASPDGRRLAYLTGEAGSGDCSTPTATSPPSRNSTLTTLVVRDLSSGKELRTSPETGAFSLGPPRAWSRDSDELVVDRGTSTITFGIRGGKLEDLGTAPAPPGNGYVLLPTGERVTAFPTLTGSRIATFDERTGTEQKTLIEIDLPLALLGADPSGSSFLMLGPLGDSATGWDLYRVRLGETTPTKLASGVQSAAWLDRPTPDTGFRVPNSVDGEESERTSAPGETDTPSDAITAVVVFLEGECFAADATIVSCADPHTREDFATFRHAGSLTPSSPSSLEVPLRECARLFEEYAGFAPNDRYGIVPATGGSATEPGVLETRCSALSNSGLQPTTGSIRRTNR
jgi:hypothetical protein